jgi:DNA polymerase-3 subunit epsilon
MMPRTLPPFVAIDFETANRYPNSACSVALVRVERGRVADRLEYLIRPPFRTFEFTHIHHITWRHVQNAATFEELWPSVRGFLRGARFLAAHNAPFDRGVLASCCHWYRLAEPALPFVCSCVLARRTWSLARYDLATVASHLRISPKVGDRLKPFFQFQIVSSHGNAIACQRRSSKDDVFPRDDFRPDP